jgi:hypothetical protein
MLADGGFPLLLSLLLHEGAMTKIALRNAFRATAGTAIDPALEDEEPGR